MIAISKINKKYYKFTAADQLAQQQHNTYVHLQGNSLVNVLLFVPKHSIPSAAMHQTVNVDI